MVWPSWFRRSNKETNDSRNRQRQLQEEQEQKDVFGITNQLVDHVKAFTIETFKNFPHQDEEMGTSSGGNSTSGNVQKDLSEWQEQHAILILSKVKELAQLRFKLCPCHLKEQEFWRTYFTLVWNDVAEYELQAVQRAKLKKMAMGNEETSETGGFEVEMAETKQAASSEPPTP